MSRLTRDTGGTGRVTSRQFKVDPSAAKGPRIKKADPGKVGFEWSWWKVLWVVGERTFHIGGRMDRWP